MLGILCTLKQIRWNVPYLTILFCLIKLGINKCQNILENVIPEMGMGCLTNALVLGMGGLKGPPLTFACFST